METTIDLDNWNQPQVWHSLFTYVEECSKNKPYQKYDFCESGSHLCGWELLLNEKTICARTLDEAALIAHSYAFKNRDDDSDFYNSIPIEQFDDCEYIGTISQFSEAITCYWKDKLQLHTCPESVDLKDAMKYIGVSI